MSDIILTDELGETIVLEDTPLEQIILEGGLQGPPGAQGPQGNTGAPGVGVPSGGLTNYYLKKRSGIDFDTVWSQLSTVAESGAYGDLSGLPDLTLYTQKSNNLSDVGNVSTARHNLGLGTADTPTFAGLTISSGGDINVGSGFVHNVANPSSAQDAATKSYVDGLIPSLPVSIANGGTGQTTAAGALGALSGHATADFSLNSHKITDLSDGVSAQDAATFGQIPTSASAIGGLLAGSNLSDVASVATAFGNIKQAASFLATGVVRQTIFNVHDYGAKGDLQRVLDGAMTNGSAVLTSATANFTSADVGKRISVEGALGGGRLVTTILSFTSSTSVTLAASATSTVSGKEVRWGTDDTTALLNAIAAAGPVGGELRFIPGHTYSTSLPLLYDSRTVPGTPASGTLTSNNTNVSNNDTVTVAGLVYTFVTALSEAYATGTITSNNTNVSDGDTVTVGYKTYTFKTALTGMQATGTLTSNGTNISAGDTVKLAGVYYNFVTALTGAANEVLIGATADDSLTNLASAINASAGAGTVYGLGTASNPGATSTATPTAHVLTFTAINPGTFGNTTSLGATATTLSVSGSTLSGGVATVSYQVLIGTNADDSLTNLASAINASAGLGTKYSAATKANHMASCTATPTAHVLTLTNRTIGNGTGDSCSLSTTASTLTASGSALTGGVNSTARQVIIGASADASLTNLASAINGSSGRGTLYAYATSPNTSVYSTPTPASHVLTFKAYVMGTDGNAISLAKSASTLTVSGVTLAGGVDDIAFNSLAPSIIGGHGKGGESQSQSNIASVKIQAWWDFPTGEFLIDYVAGSLNDTANLGYQVSGLILDCNNRAAGVRSFNSNNSNWRDFIVTNCTVAPNPVNKVGNPQGAVNAVAYPSNAAYLNHYDNVYAAGAIAQDGFYVAEGTGSYVRLTNCVTSLCGRYGFNTDNATVLVNCNSHGSSVAEYAPSGSLLIGCKMIAASQGNAIRIPDFNGSLTKIVGGDFIGCGTQGKNEGDSAVIRIGQGAAFPLIFGNTIRTSTATSCWAWADASAGSFISMANCVFRITADGLHEIGTQPFNDHQANSGQRRFIVNNSIGINPNGYTKGSATTSYEISRADGIYQRIFCNNNVTFSIDAGMPGDMLVLGIDPNGHTVTLPSNITLENGTASFAAFTWLTLLWDPQDSVWYEMSRSPSAFSNPMTTLGDIIYENSTPVPARLAGNTTSTKKFLTQTGTGSISAAPAWGTIAESDVTNLTTDLAAKAPLASPALTGNPTAPTQSPGDNSTKLATTAYTDSAVNAAVQGLSIKPSAIVATTSALPTYTYNNGSSGVGATITAVATGVVAIDGHNLALNDIVLVKDETSTNAPNNGLYTVTVAGAVGVALVLTRHIDMDQSTEFQGGFVFIESGTTNASAGFVCTNTSSVTVGTTNVAFQQFSGAGEITAGTGLSKSGNTISLVTPISQRIQKRITTITSSATPTINTDNCDAVTITALATAITSMTTNLSGTPNNFDDLWIRIKDNGTARSITWGASFVSSGVATLPTTTVLGKTHNMRFMYDSVAAVWVCLAADAVGF